MSKFHHLFLADSRAFQERINHWCVFEIRLSPLIDGKSMKPEKKRQHAISDNSSLPITVKLFFFKAIQVCCSTQKKLLRSHKLAHKLVKLAVEVFDNLRSI